MSATDLLEKPAAETAESGGGAANERRETASRRRFWRGYLIYVLCLVLVIVAALGFLWDRMDVYERSRPARAMETWMAAQTPSSWKQLLLERGIEAAFVDGLDLSAPEYYKRLGDYTDETPVYNVSFGGTPLLAVRLKPGEKLGFGSYRWALEGVDAVDSGFTVYVPDGATVLLDGAPLGPEVTGQRDAQPLSLSVFEENRADIPGLTKYVLNRTFTTDGVRVLAADGSELALGFSAGNSHYYPPLTMDCRILVPADAAVTVNGVALSGENASAETTEVKRSEYEIFEGIETFLPFPLERAYRTAWTVEGLVAGPEVQATMPDGTALEAEQHDGVWDFPTAPAGEPDAALAAQEHDRIMDIFDAHMAYLGNRDDNLAANYSRFAKYLVPGSEAQTQAVGAQVSLIWNHDMDTYPRAELKEVLRFGPDCFTARVEFEAGSLRDGSVYNNIYIFVRYGGEWRVVRIVNK